MRTIFRDADGRPLMVLDDPTPTDALVAARAAAGQGLTVEAQRTERAEQIAQTKWRRVVDLERAKDFLRSASHTVRCLAEHLGRGESSTYTLICQLMSEGYGFDVYRVPGRGTRLARAYHLVRDPS